MSENELNSGVHSQAPQYSPKTVDDRFWTGSPRMRISLQLRGRDDWDWPLNLEVGMAGESEASPQ